MDIGVRIAYLRKQANMTQAGLADTLHVSPKTVSKWENGYGLPDVKILPPLSAALGVDVDFLLTGRSKSAQDPFDHAENSCETSPARSAWAPPPKGIYRLRLHQVTHSNLSGWVLFFAIVILILALVGAPVEVLNDAGDEYLPTAIINFLYRPNATAADATAAWGIAIDVVWIAVFVLFAVLCIVGISSAMNGREDYLSRCAAMQFIGLAVVSVLTFIGCMIVNIYGGEIYMRPSPVFVILIICACVYTILCRLALMNNKKLGRFKGVSALVLAVTMAASITFCVLPNTIVPTVFAADSVQISDWDIQLRQDDYEINSTDFVYFDGYSTVAVRSNIKLQGISPSNATYRCTYADGHSEIRTLVISPIRYIRTAYKGGSYYNFFRVELRFDAPPTASFSDFKVSFQFLENKEQTVFTVESNSVEILPPESAAAAFWDAGGEIFHAGGSVEKGEEFDLLWDLTFPQETVVQGYASNLSDVQLFYAFGEYALVDVDEQSGEIYELSGHGKEAMLEKQANILVPVYKVKDGDVYKTEQCMELRLHIRTIPLLQRFACVRILTDSGEIPILAEWGDDLIIERYMQNL